VSACSDQEGRTDAAIAKSVLWKSKVVILDEPTASLGVAQTEQVLDLVRRLAGQGVAVILVSHNMNDVMKVADSIGVLFLGRMAAQVRRGEVTQTQVVELITAGRSGDLGLSPALLAVGAAVIGGTSLFGGHGRVIDAVLGGLVVAVVINGMSDLIQGSNSAGYEWVVTGLVLLLAAGFDAVVRRGRAG
jgi:predicted ABC-type sugar transport system permease subunit